MKPRDPSSFERLLQKKLSEHTVEPPPALWAKIERESAPSKLRFLAKKLNTNLHWLNLAATVLLLLLALFFWYQPRQEELPIAVPKLHAPLQQHLKGAQDSLDSLRNRFKKRPKTHPDETQSRSK
jgi:hypothetical protein